MFPSLLFFESTDSIGKNNQRLHTFYLEFIDSRTSFVKFRWKSSSWLCSASIATPAIGIDSKTMPIILLRSRNCRVINRTLDASSKKYTRVIICAQVVYVVWCGQSQTYSLYIRLDYRVFYDEILLLAIYDQ